MTRRTACSLIAALFIATAAQANPGIGVSHLNARMGVESLSHLEAHRPGLPPEALLVPLGNGMDGVLKGHTLAAEARLMDALTRQRLNQSVLRVASASVDGQRMGLIKLQAGRRSGDFAVADLRSDAVGCLGAAFHDGLAFDHLDLWSVVPGAGLVGDLQEHHPVFSLSVSRGEYVRAAAEAGEGPEVLDALEGVRYSPVFSRYALDAECVPSLPVAAVTDAPAGEAWETLLEEARGGYVRSAVASHDRVEAIFHGRRDQNLVALTIDDGPTPMITPLMLEILARKNVKATFFVVGQVVEQFPGLAQMIVRDGHELANHAYSNRRISRLPDDEAWAEIASCDRIVRRVTGETMRWFRPPGGRCSPGGLRAMASLGYGGAFWSRNTGDWEKLPPEQIVRNATEGLEAGDVILMHQGDMHSVEALPEIIDRVRAMGFEPTTLSALAEGGGIVEDDPLVVSELVNGKIRAE
ncbi:MAG: polysaccharide deacetylase family protein [Armatimonadota bacterium]